MYSVYTMMFPPVNPALKKFVHSKASRKHMLDQYEILEKLGEGGFGQVFKAKHKIDGTTIAIKMLSKK